MQASGRPFTRQDLERMKRADIQRICKEYGVKANMKTEALIDLLLDTVRSNISPLVQPPRPQRQPQPQPQPQPVVAAPVTRRASVRSRTTSRTSSGTRTRGTSGSSVVIHDTDDESQAEQSSTTQVSEPVASSSRVRKAKDTQLRLGVGRPVIAGGQGARAVTRTTSVAKGKRTRVSTMSRPMEETIEEEPEFSATDALPPAPPVNETASSASDQHVNTRIEKLESLLNEMNLKQQYQTLTEVTAQIDWLKTSLQQREMEIMNIRGELQACRVEVMVLRDETAKIPTLENQLRAVKEKLDKARECTAGSPSKTQATRRVSIPLAESNTNSLLPAPSILQPPALAKAQMPGPTETTLGKRHRISSSSNMTGASPDSGEGGSMSGKDLTKRVLRPSRKRTRTDERTNPGESTNLPGGSTESEGRSPEHDSADDSGTGSSAPSTVPPIGTPPPTNHLPQYFGSSVDAEQQHTPKNYEHYPTDGGLLGFSFSHAASSTPRDDVFGYIGEPFSPGSALRAGVRPTTGTSNNGGLQPGPFGDRLASPSPSPRPRTPTRQNMNSPSMIPQYGGSPLQGLDETTDFVFQFTDPERRESSGSSVPLPIALGYGFNAIMGVPPLDESPARPMQRTMYGTEVQNDTRFGEFGRDGIAGSSNWLNAGLFS